MGNRAVICTEKAWENCGLGIYLHWNGGRDSVEGFLKYCELKGYRSPASDESYAMARLVQVISNFFGGGLSIGINTLWKTDLDNGDNGVYIIDGWEISGRRYFDGEEQDYYDINEVLKAIDEAQPASEQLGKEFFEAVETPVEELKVGDEIFYLDFSGQYERVKVVGFGGSEYVNGTIYEAVPYIDKWGKEDPKTNPNNYLREKTYRRIQNDCTEAGAGR